MKQILVDVKRCLGCKSCEIACAVGHSVTKNLFTAIAEAHKPRKRVFVEQGNGLNFPVQCRHCEEPACVQACMAGALKKDADTGVVMHHADRCVGCWMCVMTCPFGALGQDKQGKVAVKCDRCSETGDPQCVKACPTKAIMYLPVDDFSKNRRVSYLTNIFYQEEGK